MITNKCQHDTCSGHSDDYVKLIPCENADVTPIKNQKFN
jgi:hypothetical protein